MNKKPGISVIVPVYNAEKYLSKCLDSILNQTFTDFELLLIDDGSSDNSGIICDEYAIKDPRILVFHKENGGVSSARNVGTIHARGVYSIHVDSDDWIEEEMLGCLYRKAVAEDADIVIADFFWDKANKTCLFRQNPEIPEARHIIDALLRDKLHGSMCNKLIRHRLYSDYKICFPENIHYCEDFLVVTQLLSHAGKIAYLPQAFYHYVSNCLSITQNMTKATFEQSFSFIDQMEGLLRNDKELLYSLNYRKLIIRKNALLSKLYTAKEYDRIYKDTDAFIFSSNFAWKIKAALWLASVGLYSLLQKVRDLV